MVSLASRPHITHEIDKIPTPSRSRLLLRRTAVIIFRSMSWRHTLVHNPRLTHLVRLAALARDKHGSRLIRPAASPQLAAHPRCYSRSVSALPLQQPKVM